MDRLENPNTIDPYASDPTLTAILHHDSRTSLKLVKLNVKSGLSPTDRQILIAHCLIRQNHPLNGQRPHRTARRVSVDFLAATPYTRKVGNFPTFEERVITMISIIKGQIVILTAMLIAFAVTLAACGGGGSSSAGGGGGSVNAATVSGTVTSNGVAELDVLSPSGLIAVVTDIVIPIARAQVAGVPVSIDCGGDPVPPAQTGPDGKFSVTLTAGQLAGGNCDVTIGNIVQNVMVALGETIEIEATMDGGGNVVIRRVDGMAMMDEGHNNDKDKDNDSEDSDDDSESDDDSDSEDSDDDDDS